MSAIGRWERPHQERRVISCRECGRMFAGDRSAARAARWEPYSSNSQHALDHGPMVCPACVLDIITKCMDAMRAAWGVNQQVDERDCYHPRSCTRCDYLGEPCGSHHPGRRGHERCTGRADGSDELNQQVGGGR